MAGIAMVGVAAGKGLVGPRLVVFRSTNKSSAPMTMIDARVPDAPLSRSHVAESAPARDGAARPCGKERPMSKNSLACHAKPHSREDEGSRQTGGSPEEVPLPPRGPRVL